MSLLIFVAFLGACMAAAATGAMFGPGRWYEELDKPTWTPPNWLFPVAWTVLYLAIAVAAWRVALSGSEVLALGLALWALQIALNTLWTPVFFGLQQLFGGLVVLGALWVSVLLTTAAFLAADWLAGLLFIPYLAWVSFAGALNYDIWRRNGDAPSAGTTEQGGA